MKKNKALILKLLPLLLFVASEEIYARRIIEGRKTEKGHVTEKAKKGTQSTGNTGKDHNHSGAPFTLGSDNSTTESSQNRPSRSGNPTSTKNSNKDDQSPYLFQPLGRPKPKRKNRQSSDYEDISYKEDLGRK